MAWAKRCVCEPIEVAAVRGRLANPRRATSRKRSDSGSWRYASLLSVRDRPRIVTLQRSCPRRHRHATTRSSLCDIALEDERERTRRAHLRVPPRPEDWPPKTSCAPSRKRLDSTTRRCGATASRTTNSRPSSSSRNRPTGHLSSHRNARSVACSRTRSCVLPYLPSSSSMPE